MSQQSNRKMMGREMADRLRDEALGSPLPFSELLHGRVMRSLEEAGPPATRSLASLVRWHTPWLAAAAAAVALALGVWALVHRGGEDPARLAHGDPHRMVTPSLLVPSLDAVLAHTAQTHARIEAAFEQGSLAYLDQDAKRLAGFLLDQVSTAASPLREGRPAHKLQGPAEEPAPSGRTQSPNGESVSGRVA